MIHDGQDRNERQEQQNRDAPGWRARDDAAIGFVHRETGFLRRMVEVLHTHEVGSAALLRPNAGLGALPPNPADGGATAPEHALVVAEAACARRARGMEIEPALAQARAP